jgi:hypothetical protein
MTSEARRNWQRAAKIALHAGHDDDMDDSSLSSDSETPSQRQARREKRSQEKQERIKSAKMLDLQYFLEMVDLKHRYGSNLRTSAEARFAIVRTNRVSQAVITMNGNEATPRRTSFTGSTMVKGRMSAWRHVHGSNWRGSECVT